MYSLPSSEISQWVAKLFVMRLVPGLNSINRLYICREEASKVVPEVTNCGLKLCGLASEQYTRTLSLTVETFFLLHAAKRRLQQRSNKTKNRNLNVKYRLFNSWITITLISKWNGMITGIFPRFSFNRLAIDISLNIREVDDMSSRVILHTFFD